MSKSDPTPPAGPKAGPKAPSTEELAHAEQLAAKSSDWVRALLPADMALEMEWLVADALALDPRLASSVARARPRANRNESGDEPLAGDAGDAAARRLAVGHDAQAVDPGRKRR